MREVFLEPFYEYVDEHIDDQQAILYFLRRYKHRCEWFHAERLRKLLQDDTQKGERALAFDSDTVASVIQNLDVLKHRFATLMVEQAPAYVSLRELSETAGMAARHFSAVRSARLACRPRRSAFLAARARAWPALPLTRLRLVLPPVSAKASPLQGRQMERPLSCVPPVQAAERD